MTDQPTTTDYTKLTYAQVKAMAFPTNVTHTECVRCHTIFNYDKSRPKPLCNSQRQCDRRLETGLPNFNKRVIATRNEDGGIVRHRRTVADTLAEIAKLQPEPQPEQPAAEQPAAEPDSNQEPAAAETPAHTGPAAKPRPSRARKTA